MYCKLASLVCNVSTILERCNWGNSDDETRHQRTEVWEIILYSLPPEVENESFKFSSKAWTPFISMYKWCYFSASEPADANLLQIHPLERKSHVDDPDNIWSCREFLVYHLACMPKYVCPTNVALLDWVRCNGAFCSELLNLSGGNNHPRRFGAFIVGTVQNNGFVLQSEHCFANWHNMIFVRCNWGKSDDETRLKKGPSKAGSILGHHSLHRYTSGE